MRGIRVVLGAVWVFGGALTVLHALHPAGLALNSPWSSAVLETAAACGASLLAALSYGRWRQRRLLPDLVTCYAFSVLTAGNVVFALLPIVAGPDQVRPSVRVAALVSGAVAAMLFAVASLAPERAALPSRPHLDVLVLALTVLVVAGGVALFASKSPDTFRGLTGAPSTEATGNSGETAVTVLQALSAAAFGLASIRYMRRGRMHADPFYGWLAVTAAFWALSRTNYAFTPEFLVSKLTVGDWLRIAAYCVAVVAAATEFTHYWRRLADTAVLEERRRIARDLHDGLAQELAFIATRTRSIAKTNDSDSIGMVARAAERALDESRRAIAALTRAVDEPLDVALAQQAEELSGRLGIRVLLDLEPVGSVDSDTREALLRIAREAITNAGRHGRPTTISVHLSNHEGVTLRVTDDGRGFLVDDPRVFAGGHYGVAGIRERAEALGGWMQLQSRPYLGTKVEVWVP
jgi:signal transduction histidine kinase